MAFDMKTSRQRLRLPFPAPASVCNDITLAKDGTAYISDTRNGRIFRVQLTPSQPLNGADGVRLIRGNLFLLAENLWGGKKDRIREQSETDGQRSRSVQSICVAVAPLGKLMRAIRITSLSEKPWT
jgi:hypothetical protein